jgi:hypothetical protein
MPLSDPPRDANGDATPHDHPDIADSDRVIRRISTHHVVRDPKAPSGSRVFSAAFQASSNGNRGMSVDLETSILQAGLDCVSFVTKPEFPGSVLFQAGFLRSEALQVGYDPLPGNPHYGEVWGDFSRSRRSRLLAAARWLNPIPGVDLTVPAP